MTPASSRFTVFCDFDGTITAEETFSGALKIFGSSVSREILPKLFAREMTLREGVRKILESIPSNRYLDMIGYADDKLIRAGFDELLSFLELQGVPFVVVSGGFMDMVEQVLTRSGEASGRPFRDRILSVAAVNIDASQEFLQVDSPFEGGNELVEKVQVMRQFPTEKTIAIGDSVTDINMALAADLVFARDRLPGYLDELGKDYIVWDNFYDIQDYLTTYLNSFLDMKN